VQLDNPEGRKRDNDRRFEATAWGVCSLLADNAVGRILRGAMPTSVFDQAGDEILTLLYGAGELSLFSRNPTGSAGVSCWNYNTN